MKARPSQARATEARLCADAMAALKRNDFALAERLYDDVVQAGTKNPDVHYNLAVLAQRRGDLGAAVAGLESALALAPHRADLRQKLTAVLEQHITRARTDKAWTVAANALVRLRALRGDDPGLLHTLGESLLQAGRFDEGLPVAERLIESQPERAEGYNLLGLLLDKQGKLAEAFSAYERGLAVAPSDTNVLINIGMLASRLGRHGSAIAFFVRALENGPNAGLFLNLGNVLNAQGEIADSVRAHRAAITLEPGFNKARSGLLFTLNYDTTVTPEAVAREHRDYGLWAVQAFGPPRTLPARDPRPERRLRVAYTSPDFRRHSVSFFIEPVLTTHDRTQVEVFGYALAPGEDDVTRRLRGSCEHWREAWSLSDDEFLALCERDQIDVIVDLCGHTGRNRLSALARRAAPVQVTYLGYPNTTGIPAMDVRVTDALVDPEGPADSWHTERLARVKGGFLCYQPPSTAPEVKPPPSTTGAPFMFGSFNNLAKLSDLTMACWARILAGAPHARLLLKAKSLNDPRVRKRLLSAFAARGVDESRVDLGGHTLRTEEHLAIYGLVDVALDSFPYNGTTTTCEALWMGVPVLALEGTAHAGRVSADILRRIGLDEFCATTVDDYVDRALSWTNRRDDLCTLRQGLRDRMRTSPLMDAPRMSSELERVYRDAWSRLCP